MQASSVLQCLSSKLFARCNDTVCSETNSESFYFKKEANLACLVSVFFTSHYSVSCNNRSVQRDSSYLKSAEEGTRAPSHAQFLSRHEETKTNGFAIVVFLYLCVTPHSILYVIPYWRSSCAIQRVVYFVGIFSFYLSSIVSPTICLSFVKSYRRGLRNILSMWHKT